MKTSELRAKTVAELQTMLTDAHKTLVENKRSLAAGELPNPRVVGNTRREIARIKTLLTESTLKSSKGDA